jgi:uncharacterized lipoprotein YddW (UPF0748 family)
MTFSGLVLVLQLVLCFAYTNAAWAASPLAVLNSLRNGQNYQDQHIGTWDDDYKVFKKALDGSNVRYDELTDADVDAGPSKLSAYKLIVVPLLVDLPASEVANLQEFTRAGGKLLLTDGAGSPGAGAQSLLQLAGVASAKQVTIKEVNKLVWPRQPLPVSGEFAIASVVCQLNLAGGQSLAGWQGMEGQELGCAIARQGNVIFVGWAPGAQGEITTNAQFLSQCLDELSPGITQQAAVQISYADYQTISQELDYLAKRTDEAIKTARQAEFAVPLKEIQSKYDAALVNVQSFNSSYRERLFLEADQFLQKARQEFALAFAQAMPVRPVEARCVWLDRGTIVACRSAQGMAKLFDKLQQANINVVYFETNNAGFAMFPSKIYAQNPETLSWDPLGAACEEAHKRGMEFHAWFWIFGVGNNKHNPIIGKEADYPGPVLAGHDLTWALTSQSGALVPARQFEYWLDPSNSECRQHVKSLILEVVNRYPVEGIQLDYIRYPFNNRGSEMGFNWLGRLKFERETGLSLDRLDDTTREVFVHWKAAQITSFVKEVSDLLRSQKPNIRISAAVYAMPKRLRVNAIQQEWETWVANGWVDTINPMTYVSTPKELAEAAGFVRESTADKALSYPGLSIRQLDQAGLIEQLDQSRVVGTLGTTMFAVAHLDDKKCSVLQVGPYRKAPSMTPQAEPIKASRLLFDDFANMVNSYLQDPKKRIMSDTASTNDVLSQIDSVQKNINFLSSASTPEEIDGVLHEVVALHNSIREWLRLEAFIQRGFRAQYIANYLGQVEAILSYGAKRVRTQAALGRTVAAQEAKPGINLPLE